MSHKTDTFDADGLAVKLLRQLFLFKARIYRLLDNQSYSYKQWNFRK